jgi:hypothetical protein
MFNAGSTIIEIKDWQQLTFVLSYDTYLSKRG